MIIEEIFLLSRSNSRIAQLVWAEYSMPSYALCESGVLAIFREAPTMWFEHDIDCNKVHPPDDTLLCEALKRNPPPCEQLKSLTWKRETTC